MTQIVLMLYEDPQADKDSDKRFHIELHFSPGVKCHLEEAAKDSKLNSFHKNVVFRTKEEETDGKLTETCKSSEHFENNLIRKEHASDIPVSEETEQNAQSSQIEEGLCHRKSCRRRSEDLSVRCVVPAEESEERNTVISRRKSTGRSQSECECPVKSSDAFSRDADNLLGYKAKSLGMFFVVNKRKLIF